MCDISGYSHTSGMTTNSLLKDHKLYSESQFICNGGRTTQQSMSN